jgi:hypothetical protein
MPISRLDPAEELLLEEEREELKEKEIIKEIEEKLESDYKYYQQIKQMDGEGDRPELSIKKAAEMTLDNLCESHERFKSVLKLIKSCFNDYIEAIESKNQELASENDAKNDKIKLIELEINSFKVNFELKNNELKTTKESLENLQKEFELKINKIKELEKEVAEKPQQQDGKIMGKYDQKQICKEIKDLLTENEELKSYALELKNELEYGKQRENKLMYFLFLLQQKEYPVFDVFETYVKDLSTQRFSTDLDEGYKHIYIEQMRKLKELGLLEKDIHKSERRKKSCKKLEESEASFEE